jgi:hypothetical protein
MELALNLVWVFVALAGIALLGSDLSRASERSVGPLTKKQKIIAMCCALIILFFVISMTDDLHGIEILAEDNKSLRAAAWVGAVSQSLPQATTTLVFVVPSVFECSPDLPALRKLIETSKVLSTIELYPELSSGRAPPPSLA